MNKQITLFLLITLFFQTLFSQKKIPVLTEFVTDKANLLSLAELANLEQRLKDYEIKTTNQIVVVVIDSLGRNTIEQYANRLFNDNKIGQEKEDNGLLILVSKNDRKVKLEVGYGLEHLITDAKSSRIIREIIIPEFKKQKYYQGINLGLSEVINTINKTSTITEDTSVYRRNKIDQVNNVFKIIEIVFFGLILVLPVILFYVNLSWFYSENYQAFLKIYRELIHLFRGVLVGKIGIYSFFKWFLMYSIAVVVIVFLLMFLSGVITIVVIFMNYCPEESSKWVYDSFLVNGWFYIFAIIILCFVVPLLIALYNRKQIKGLPIKLTLDTSLDKEYINTYLTSFKNVSSGSRSYSSSGSSSFSSASSSSSSSSSFSGGGGSSGGGGASGSW